jgi:glutamyl-tRNA reductase
MKLFCVGISHHTANVETRERYAGACSEDAFRTAAGCSEALMLATCNRVEVYAAAGQPIATEEVLRALQKCGAGEIENTGAFYRYEGEACIAHLFRVVAGLDSMVVGETEILGQVKKAYASARESGNAGPLLRSKCAVPPISRAVRSRLARLRWNSPEKSLAICGSEACSFSARARPANERHAL